MQSSTLTMFPSGLLVVKLCTAQSQPMRFLLLQECCVVFVSTWANKASSFTERTSLWGSVGGRQSCETPPIYQRFLDREIKPTFTLELNFHRTKFNSVSRRDRTRPPSRSPISDGRWLADSREASQEIELLLKGNKEYPRSRFFVIFFMILKFLLLPHLTLYIPHCCSEAERESHCVSNYFKGLLIVFFI